MVVKHFLIDNRVSSGQSLVNILPTYIAVGLRSINRRSTLIMSSTDH